jgi:hypothetical protein
MSGRSVNVPGAASLGETQEFLGTLLRRSTPLMEATTDEEQARVASLISGNGRLTPLAQLEIYREQFWLRHRDSLADDFPALTYLLGREAFFDLARAYLAAHPPSSYTLRDLPLALPAFAATYMGFAPEVAAAARELTRFEVGFITTFDAPAVSPVSPEKVAAVPSEAWPGARLQLHPGLALFALEHPLHTFRSAVRRDETPLRELESRRVHVALWRGEDLRVHQAELAPAEHALLAALGEGLPLETACVRATAEEDGEEPPVATWFEGWARRGWVIDVLVGHE